MRFRLATAHGRTSWGKTRPTIFIVLLAVGAVARPASAQVGNSAADAPAAEAGQPLMYGGNGEWGDFLFNFQYHTRGYGEEAGLGSLGINRFWLLDRVVLFANASVRIDDDRLRPPSPSFGGGLRLIHENWLGGASERILGANVWYDGTHTGGVNPSDNYSYFQQLGIGLESLGERWDFRLNANIPIATRERMADMVFGATMFEGHELVAPFTQFQRFAVRAVEGEVARRLGERNLWAFASCYGLDGGGQQAVGGKAGLRGYLVQDVLASLSLSQDDMFGTSVMFNIAWFLDWGAHGRAEMAPACITDRFREPVQRNDYVAVLDKVRSGSVPATDAVGTPLFFVFADSNAASGGDGTYEHPFATLALTQGNSSPGDYLFLDRNSVFVGQSLALQNGQRLFGEGITHTINAYLSGQPTLLTLPDRGGPIPIIQNAPGDAVTLAHDNAVSGLVIDGATNGITAPSGTSNAEIDHLTVQNTTAAGLNFQQNGGTVGVDQFTYTGTSGHAASTSKTAAPLLPSAAWTSATTSGEGFQASGGGTIGLTGGSNSIATTTGVGLDLNGVAIASSGMAFASVSTDGATNGIRLTNVGGGLLAVAGGTIDNSTAAGVFISGGTPHAAIDAAMANSAAHAVDIEGLTGGNVAFGGAITDSGTGLLVQNNSGGSVSFSGAMTLHTAATTPSP